MDKKKLNQILIFTSLGIMILSVLAYLNFGNPKNLKPPRGISVILPKNITATVKNETDEYLLDVTTSKKLNLSQFNVTKADYILNNYNYDATIYLKSNNISEVINYLKQNNAIINKIKRNVLISITFLNTTKSTYAYIPIEKIKNNSVDLTCYIKYVDKVPISIEGCIPR